MLGALYPTAAVAFVGGTLVPVGGHNVLEPALSNIPVLFGPHTGSTQVTADALLSGGGGEVVEDAAGLAARLIGLFSEPDRRRSAGEKAGETAARFTGATQRTLEHLRPLLLPEKP